MATRDTIHLCLARPSDEGLELKYIHQAFDTNWIVPLGPNVDAFERDLSLYYGRPVCAMNSATSALHIALLLMGVQRGDEVLVQSFTFCATVNPVCYIGAHPIFVDSERDTWNMSPALLEKAIRDRIEKTGRKPKAIIVVDLYGMPAKMDEILRIARDNDIPVLEDSAESMGSVYRGHRSGTMCDYAVVSFNGNKMITTSGGGALICPDDKQRQLALKYATQAREKCSYYQHELIGYNYRMSNVCAGIGRGQMTVLDRHVEHHRHLHQLYSDAFRHIDGIQVHQAPGPDYASNYWLTTLSLDPDIITVDGQEHTPAADTYGQPDSNIEALVPHLAQAHIETRPLWKPLHLQPVFSRLYHLRQPRDFGTLLVGPTCSAYLNGVSDDLFSHGLCLPSGPCVSDDDARYVVDTIMQHIQR